MARLSIHSPPLPSGARANSVTGHDGNLTRVHAVPFRCCRNPAIGRLLGGRATTQTLPGATATRSPNCRPVSALLLTRLQLRPL